MPLSTLQILKSEIRALANEPITVYGLDYFKKLKMTGIDVIIRRLSKIIETEEYDNTALNILLSNLHKLKHEEFNDKIASILVYTWKYLNNLERKNILQKLDKAIDKTVKTKLLADVEHFLLKMQASESEIERNATSDYVTFVKEYDQLIKLGPTISAEFINKLYDIIPVDIKKSVDDKLSKIIEIDNYAHIIHNSNCGEEVKNKLDAIAIKAKAVGEESREDRLLVLCNPNASEQLRNMSKLEILCKAKILEQRLRYRAEKYGIENLDNEELCVLLGFLSGEIN